MTDPWLDAGGETISADSIRARLSAENQAAIDAKLARWFSNPYENFDADAVMEAGKRAL